MWISRYISHMIHSIKMTAFLLKLTVDVYREPNFKKQCAAHLNGSGCGCIRVYLNRGLYKFCCCCCRFFNCCWMYTDKAEALRGVSGFGMTPKWWVSLRFSHRERLYPFKLCHPIWLLIVIRLTPILSWSIIVAMRGSGWICYPLIQFLEPWSITTVVP